MGFFPMGLKNEFETAIVIEPSVFEPLKFYCIYLKRAHSLYIEVTVQCFFHIARSQVDIARI